VDITRRLAVLSQDAPDNLVDESRDSLESRMRRLVPGCERLMAPDAAGTHAYLLAGLVAEAEPRQAEPRHDLERDLEQLPAFVAEHDGRSLRELVGRFLAGERPSGPSAPIVAATTFSARPLDPAQTRLRLRQLAAAGVDLSLLRAQLALTPEGRVESMMALADTCRLLGEAAARARFDAIDG